MTAAVQILAVEWELLKHANPGAPDRDLAERALSRGRAIVAGPYEDRVPEHLPPAERLARLRWALARKAASVAIHRFELVSTRERLARAEEGEQASYERHLELHKDAVPPLKLEAKALRSEVRLLEAEARELGIDVDAVEPRIDWPEKMAVDDYESPQVRDERKPKAGGGGVLPTREERVTATTIYLVRHGRTALNTQGRFRGRQDPPLDDRGFVEASEAASRLAGTGVRAVYAGPLLRSVQTAEVIAWTSGIELFVEHGLIDFDHGVWTGLTSEEAGQAEPKAFTRFREEPRHAAAPGGESMPELERRTLVALTWIAERHGGEAAAAVSHEVPIRLVIARLAEIEGPAFWDVQLPTGSVTKLNFEDGAFSLAGDIPTRAVP